MSKSIRDFYIGEQATLEKTITEEDVQCFAQLSGDFNPVHIDQDFASHTIFKGRIAHGLLVSSFISTVLGTILPGYGSIYLSQDLKFRKAVYLNDTVTVQVTIKELIEEKNRVILDTIAINQNNEVVVTGTATLLCPTN